MLGLDGCLTVGATAEAWGKEGCLSGHCLHASMVLQWGVGTSSGLVGTDLPPTPSLGDSIPVPTTGPLSIQPSKVSGWALPWGESGFPSTLMSLGAPGFTMCEGAFQGLWDSAQRLALRESPMRAPGVCLLSPLGQREPRGPGDTVCTGGDWALGGPALGRGRAGFNITPTLCAKTNLGSSHSLACPQR